jgi:hypothetical protein
MPRITPPENETIVDDIRLTTSHVLCHCCGYEPPNASPPFCCPKCHSSAWERFLRIHGLEDSAPQSDRSAARNDAPRHNGHPHAAHEESHRHQPL